MNIEHKKTALDDDSVIYQKRDDSLGKKDTSTLTAGQKLGYFRDYYLKIVIVAAIILVILGSLIYNMFFRHQVTVLSAAFMDDARIVDTSALTSDLRAFFSLTRDDDFIDIENYDSEDYTSQIKFTTLVAAQSIDVFVLSKEEFQRYAEMGYFADLSKFLPAELYQEYKQSGRILTASEVERDMDDRVIATHPAAPYGIDMSDSPLFQNYTPLGDEAVLGIFAATKNPGNVLHFLTFAEDPSAEPVQAESQQTSERSQ